MAPNTPPSAEEFDAMVDPAALAEQVFAERMRQYMSRQRMSAASGAVPSAYLVILLWGHVDHTHLIAWWLALFAVDLCTVLHTTSFFRQQPQIAQLSHWKNRQTAIQTLAGLVWGVSVALTATGAAQLVESDAALVLTTVSGVAVIAFLPFSSAVLFFTAGLWFVPALSYSLNPTPHHINLLFGLAVLIGSLNFYLWPATRQLVEGIEESLRAKALSGALHEAMVRIHELANHDELTGIYNRREGMRMLAEWISAPLGDVPKRRQDVEPRELGVLMLDIDHFKQVNDHHGHPAGDEVLRTVCRRLQAQIRTSDILARIGGEEFMVLLPNSPLDATRRLAERLRYAVAEEAIVYGEAAIDVSISIGLTMLRPETDAIEQLLARADAALYEAKRGGRNRVVETGNGN